MTRMEAVTHITHVKGKETDVPIQEVKTWRPTLADVQLLDRLKRKLGVVSEAELVRMGLRKLAESQGLST